MAPISRGVRRCGYTSDKRFWRRDAGILLALLTITRQQSDRYARASSDSSIGSAVCSAEMTAPSTRSLCPSAADAIALRVA